MEGVGGQLRHVLRCEGRKGDLTNDCPGFLNGFELPRQRVAGIYFVVSIGADQQQVLHVWLDQQIFNQIERRRVEPLQIVEK